LVLTGSLAPPVLRAVLANFSETPSISNKIAPPATFLTQWLTDPLPLPILTSIGFAVIGKFGKILTQTRPSRFIFLVIACLADSICLADIEPEFIAFKPKIPNFNWLDLYSNLGRVPFLYFLNFVFFGCNNILFFANSDFYTKNTINTV